MIATSSTIISTPNHPSLMIQKIKSLLRNTFVYRFYKTMRGKYALLKYDNPSNGMFVIWITGTNGKTTTSFMIHHIFNTLIDKAFLLWTNEIKYGTESVANTSKMTSPDVMDVQKYLAQAKAQGCHIAVLETASHGLDQDRFHGIDFDMGILTNITPEHLDYHKSMEEYAKTKKKLFQNVATNSKPNKMAILPKDDKIGREWADELGIEKTMTFGIVSGATLKAEAITYTVDSTSFTINYMGQLFPMTMKMVWIHNVYNTLTALCAGLVVWLDLNDMIATFTTFQPPLGRMEPIIHNNTHYFVDFAHTPDALEKTLSYLASIKKDWRLLLLTWAMGQRDRFKRPMMGKLADQYADIIVLADEDPGEEPRFQIIQEIKDGINRYDGDNLFIIPDRQKAIQFLTQIARPGDVVLLAGKGHETVMSVPGGKVPRNEKVILENYLQEKK